MFVSPPHQINMLKSNPQCIWRWGFGEGYLEHRDGALMNGISALIRNMDITRWSILKSLQPKMEKLYTVSKTRLGADCGSDHEHLIAKFILKLQKVGKTTRPFRCDLNQNPYDYTVEVRSRFKGLHLIDRDLEKLWLEVCDIVQEARIKIIPKKKKGKKTK